MIQKSWKKKSVYGSKKREWAFKEDWIDVTEDNDLFYVGATLVTKVFEKNKTKGEKKQLWKVTLKSLTKIWGD